MSTNNQTKKKIIKLILFLIYFSSAVNAGITQIIYLDSSEYIEGSTITVGIDPFITPCLLFIPNVDNEYSHIEIQGNIVTLYVVAYSFSPCSGNGSSAREEFNFSAPDIGEYVLQVNWVGPNTTFPITPSDNFIPLGTTAFSIVRGEPVTVNTLSVYALILLSAAIFVLSLIRFNRYIRIR